jgi:hypothetical protein
VERFKIRQDKFEGSRIAKKSSKLYRNKFGSYNINLLFIS